MLGIVASPYRQLTPAQRHITQDTAVISACLHGDELVLIIAAKIGNMPDIPTVWNSLPAHLRSTLIDRRQFRDGLKSHLFADAYV